jgi:hypothetical protein
VEIKLTNHKFAEWLHEYGQWYHEYRNWKWPKTRIKP